MGCRDHDYHNFLFSMKASNPLVMVQAYRLLSEEMYLKGWDYPLHLGVTEVGKRTMHDKGWGPGSGSKLCMLVSGRSELILMHPGLLSANSGVRKVHLWDSLISKRLLQLLCLHLQHSSCPWLMQAGEGEDGRMKSAIGIGALLMDGLGDTIRVSLTEDPELEIIPCG